MGVQGEKIVKIHIVEIETFWATLRIRIAVYTRQFNFGKKSTLHSLIRSLHIYQNLKSKILNGKIRDFCQLLLSKYEIYLNPTHLFNPTRLFIFKNFALYTLIQDYTGIRILRVGFLLPPCCIWVTIIESPLFTDPSTQKEPD